MAVMTPLLMTYAVSEALNCKVVFKFALLIDFSVSS